MAEWIKGWTFFNWLAVIAFILALVGFLNSVLSLRSRYLDWRGGQSKKAFEKRLKQLETLAKRVGSYRKEPWSFVFMLAHNSVRIIFFVVSSLAAFLAAFANIHIPPITNYPAIDSPIYTYIFIYIAYILMIIAMGLTSKLVRTVAYVNRPSLLKKKIIEFVRNGAEKNLVPEQGAETISQTLFDNNLITIDEYEDLNHLLKPPTC